MSELDLVEVKNFLYNSPYLEILLGIYDRLKVVFIALSLRFRGWIFTGKRVDFVGQEDGFCAVVK